jgi:hypothetical protein
MTLHKLSSKSVQARRRVRKLERDALEVANYVTSAIADRDNASSVSLDELEEALIAFNKAGKKLGVLLNYIAYETSYKKENENASVVQLRVPYRDGL